jgi:hypothetical protein
VSAGVVSTGVVSAGGAVVSVGAAVVAISNSFDGASQSTSQDLRRV